MDLQNERNRRLYERTAIFLLMAAVHESVRDADIRVNHSMGVGVYVTVDGMILSRTRVRRIEERMREMVHQNLPITTAFWEKEKAISFFTEQGQTSTVRLLKYAGDTVPVHTCGDYTDYVAGDTAPSAGDVADFSLRLFYPGMVLILKSMSEGTAQQHFVDRPKLTRAYMEAQDVSQLMHCENAADLNEIIETGRMRDLIRVCESIQSRKIVNIAEEIVGLGCNVIFIAGPSSSGKTTFANRLALELMVSGRNPVPISLDNYYKNRVDIPIGEDGKPDLESIEAIDTTLFNEQLLELLQGAEVEIPRYSFFTKNREPEGWHIQMSERDVLIVEGIHGLNPLIGADVPGESKYRIYVSPLTPPNLDNHNRIRATDVRLLRRLVRDARTRNASVFETLDMWDNVKLGEIKYIYPYQEQANVIFNTTLSYEIPFLKRAASEMLAEVGEDSPHYSLVRRIRTFLSFFVEAEDADEIPPISILREFYGGCTFYNDPVTR